MDIIKASGEKEKFSKEKLEQSLRRAGVGSDAAEKVVKEVEKKVKPGISSEKILEHTGTCLLRENPEWAARYNLKRALFELGPTGYPFEKYVGQVLEQYGYRVRVGVIVRGVCVAHEVDVIASRNRRGTERYMVECKYHNRSGIKSDVKVAMYVYARFLDLKNNFNGAWLVTNTKCTSQAIRYAKCAGIKIISWRYPKGESLENLIEKKGLYPITVLPGLSRYAKQRLFEKNTVFVGDLARRSAKEVSALTGLKGCVAQKLQGQAKNLCAQNIMHIYPV